MHDPFSVKDSAPLQQEKPADIPPFRETLAATDLLLRRDKTYTLQVNVGLRCNQTCKHCHLEAGPERTENMQLDTVKDVLAYAARGAFESIDITGGAPELNPHLPRLLEGLAPLTPRLLLRCNLTALNEPPGHDLLELLSRLRVVVVASLPSLNASQADAQRGNASFERSIEILQRLNRLGYGHQGTGLELDLVSNPTGAFLPPSQVQTEQRYREVLAREWGIAFNYLFNFANVPLGRFRRWLLQSGNFRTYMHKLATNFNPCAVDRLMCRSLISVGWDGYLFDCDFNLACGLHLGGRKTHVSEMPGRPAAGSEIATGDHCYACTAGSGFT
jgi:radical SAM/Cys-rich protein